MSTTDFAVYPPPRPGLPHLAVEILPDGTISATPYETKDEAESHERLAERALHAEAGTPNSLGSLLP